METRSSASQAPEDARVTQTMPGSGRQRGQLYFDAGSLEPLKTSPRGCNGNPIQRIADR
jgi:hypothetical protein